MTDGIPVPAGPPGIELVYAGTGLVMTGGIMSALAAIATITFGIVPVALIGFGAVVMAVGFYERFVLRK